MRNVRSIGSCAKNCCAVFARGSAAAATAAIAGVIAVDARVKDIEIALGMRTLGGSLSSPPGGSNPTAPALLSAGLSVGSIRSYPPSLTESGAVFCKPSGEDNFEVPCSAPLAKYLYYDVDDENTPVLIRNLFATEMAKTDGARTIVENEDYFALSVGGSVHTMFRVLGDYDRSSVYYTDTKQQYTMVVDAPVDFALFVQTKPDPEDPGTWTHYGYALCGSGAADSAPADGPDAVDPDALG
jgi:hypothetical protein